jgi:hypothetical protein
MATIRNLDVLSDKLHVVGKVKVKLSTIDH